MVIFKYNLEWWDQILKLLSEYPFLPGLCLLADRDHILDLVQASPGIQDFNQSVKTALLDSSRAHARSLMNRKVGECDSDAAFALELNDCANLLSAFGVFQEAIPLYEQAVYLCLMPSGTEDSGTETSSSLVSRDTYVASPKGCRGNGAVEPIFRKVLARRRKEYGPDHVDTIPAINNLAQCLFAKGQIDEAESLYRHAWSICIKELGHEHPHTDAAFKSFSSCV